MHTKLLFFYFLFLQPNANFEGTVKYRICDDRLHLHRYSTEVDICE